MYCDQCQETMSQKACVRNGICGKSAQTADLQDLLVRVTKGMGALATHLRKEKKQVAPEVNSRFRKNLCLTMTNTNFDPEALTSAILASRDMCRKLLSQTEDQKGLPEAEIWEQEPEAYLQKAGDASEDPAEEDIRSFRKLLLAASKGIAALLLEASELGGEDTDADIFIQRALAQTLDGALTAGNLLAVVMEAGRYSVRAMDLLNRARISAFGMPEKTVVTDTVRNRPGILVTGSDMYMLHCLLEQTKDSGVDVYTHGELLCAHAYPKLKEYPHFAGHYGGSWQTQKEDFERFHGPVLAVSEGIFLPKASYKGRLYTAGCAGIPGCTHFGESLGPEECSILVRQAEQCAPPEPGKGISRITGLGHAELFRHAEETAEAIRQGTLARIAVIAGDDGRIKRREYYTDLVRALPEDVLILTAGGVQFRMPDSEGELCGMPRIAGTGEQADIYAVIQFALRLRETLGVDSLNQLPMFYMLSWHGQRSLMLLLALLYLDIRQIRLGPTRPAFLSPNVWDVFAGYFGLKEIRSVQQDLEEILGVSEDLIREDMIVGDVIDQYPSLIPVMAEMGLHCIGCGVSRMETLAEACAAHGLNGNEFLHVLNTELRRPAGQEQDHEKKSS